MNPNSARPRSLVRGTCALLSLALIGLPACQPRRYNSGLKASSGQGNFSESEPGVISACMGMQGNGHLFSSHIGTLIALFENSIDPKIIVGGSSGSIVGSIGRALMNNTSIRNAQVTIRTPSGEVLTLTSPQKAALILAASEEVMNGFLFLPGVDTITPGQFQSYLAGFFANLKSGQLPDQADFKLMNVEPTVGSAVLITSFFQLYDFSKILNGSAVALAAPSPDTLGEFRSRRDALVSAFRQYTKAKEWTFAQIIGLLTDPKLAMAEAGITKPEELGSDAARLRLERLLELRKLFKEDETFVPEKARAEFVAEHLAASQDFFLMTGLQVANGIMRFSNEVNKLLSAIIQTNPDDPNYKTFSNRILNGTFVIPDAGLIRQAYQGLVPDPKDDKKTIFFPVPEGMIIHSTFRRGSVQDASHLRTLFGKLQPARTIVKGFSGIPGFENLYQGYIVGEPISGAAATDPNSLVQEMKARRDAAWRDWKASGKKTWRMPLTEVLGNGFSRAAFLAYDLGSLNNARASIRLEPVPNFSALSNREVLPRNPDLSLGEMESYIDPNRVLIFDPGSTDAIRDFRNRGLNFAIQASAGEPGAFRRYAIKWTEHDQALNTLDGESAVDLIQGYTSQPPAGFETARMVPFGGWGENVPLSSIAHLDACKKAQIFVTSALDAPGNEFQAGALVATVSGRYDGKAELTPEQKELRAKAVVEAEGHFQRLTAAASFSRSLPGKVWIHNDLDFNAPCKADADKSCSPAEVKKINAAITPLPWGETRLNLAIIGYQTTMSSLKSATLGNPEVVATLQKNVGLFNSFGQPIHNDLLMDLRTRRAEPKPFLGRLFAPSESQRIKTYLDAVRLGTPVEGNR